MATTTPNFGWAVPTSTDLVKDGAVAIETLGDSIDASLVDLKGGTTGQVLTKASNTDMDFSWTAVDPLVILDAKGDLITATAADTPARLAVGTNGQVLTADSTAATGLKWATAGGGGKVLQVVSANATAAVSSSSTTYVTTGLTATITPTLSTSKILVLVTQNGCFKNNGNSNNALNIRLRRSSTTLAANTFVGYTATASENGVGTVAFSYLDSPATTSATTYLTEFSNFSATSFVAVQQNSGDTSSIVLLEIGA